MYMKMNNPQKALYYPHTHDATELLIYGMGIGVNHHPDHVARTPVFDGHLIMCFRNHFFCTTDNGTAQGGPGDCIIYAPHYPQEHGAAEGNTDGFTNDWISIHWDGIPALMKEFDLPINSVISAGVPSLMEPFLTKIHFEVYDDAPFAPRVISTQVELLILEIARMRERTTGTNTLSRADLEIRNRLLDIRVKVHQRLGQDWTVTRMAAEANLSAGYFATRYTEFFGISPIDDLVGQRIELAKRLLLREDYEIAVIAERCGFADVYYFNRAFKKRVGSPPGSYRKRLLAQV